MKPKNIKKTSFKVTCSALELEDEILRHVDIGRTLFHRRMIDYYLAYDRSVHPRLLKNPTEEGYAEKRATEQIYLDEERELLLKEVARQHSTKKKKCTVSVVLFQALLTYLSVQAPLVLGEEAVAEMIRRGKEEKAKEKEA